MRKHIQQRLVLLSDKAKKIGQGDIKPNLKIRGKDELSELGDVMNTMCTRLLKAQRKLSKIHEDRIKTLEQLRHTERLSTVGHIAAGIAHELGTPP